MTIFVNPTQFNQADDLAAYPRDLQGDLALLEGEGVDLVWCPSVEEIYPPGSQTAVEVEQISRPLEGASRPGHFRGVATVVTKLLCAVAPQRAYFGQKDAQQVQVVRRLVKDLLMPLEVRVGPTVREPDGLAMSSRNVHLSRAERRAATVLHRALRAAQESLPSTAEQLRQKVREVVASQPLVELEYVSCADPDTLEELDGDVREGLLSVAAQIGQTRLIDNLLLCSSPLTSATLI